MNRTLHALVAFGTLGFLFCSPPNQKVDPASMWRINAGDIRLERAGYAVAPDVESYKVYVARPEQGAYHHHPFLCHFDGVFYAAFSECRNGEDGPGQRVRVLISENGKTWKGSTLAVEAPDDYALDWKEAGRMSTPIGLFALNERVWVISKVEDIVGYTDTPGSDRIVSRVKKSGLQKVRRDIGDFASEINMDGTIGRRFWIMEKPPKPVVNMPSFLFPTICDQQFSRFRESFLRKAKQHETGVGPADRLMQTTTAVDGHRLCEHTLYQRPDGVYVQLARDLNYSHRIYYSESKDGTDFTIPVQTNIPDSQSKTIAGSLPDGRIYIIGNFLHNPETDATRKHYKRYPLVIALSEDGKQFEKAYAIRYKATEPRFEVGGSSDGYQYPDAIVVGEDLWVIYSVNKQDIHISRISWGNL
jgi:hypothetical protein